MLGPKHTRHTAKARRLAASCAGPLDFLMVSLCLASCWSSLAIFSSSLPFAGVRKGLVSAETLLPTQNSYVSPLTFSLPVASSSVGGDACSFFVPKIRFIPSVDGSPPELSSSAQTLLSLPETRSSACGVWVDDAATWPEKSQSSLEAFL